MKTFVQWVENEESPSLSEPQHKKGESNMRLDDIVERRVKQMIMDLESSGKGTQKEILDSVVKYAGKMGVKAEQPTQQPQQNQPQDISMDAAQATVQGGTEAPQVGSPTKIA